MAKILKYQKVIDNYTTHCLVEPDYNTLDTENRVTEFCTIAGWTYVSVPDDVVLPEQPDVIAATLAEIDLNEDPGTKEAINKISPHVELINNRVVEKIRLLYSINDEIKYLRLSPSVESDTYNEYAESCRAWGRAEKEKLGL